jgi:hypothetical protein
MNEKYNFPIWDENWEDKLEVNSKVKEEIEKYSTNNIK